MCKQADCSSNKTRTAGWAVVRRLTGTLQVWAELSCFDTNTLTDLQWISHVNCHNTLGMTARACSDDMTEANEQDYFQNATDNCCGVAVKVVKARNVQALC